VSQQLLLDELKKGPGSWNEWRQAHPAVRIDLTGAYLAETNLRGYDLRRADLSRCVLVGADLTRADLRDANLSHSDVRFAEFESAQLAGAHFDAAEGVTKKALRASLPRTKFISKQHLIASAATVLAFAAIFSWQELAGLAFTGSTSNTKVEQPGESADRFERFTREIRKAEFPAWRIEAIEITDKAVALRVNRDQVTDDTYLLTLAAACGAVLEVPEVTVSAIHVLNRGGNAGWIYDNPNHCGVLLSAPIATLRLSAAANSRPFAGDQF
jgi:hypothetical protein